MVGPKDPSLEQAGHSMYGWHGHMCWIIRGTQHRLAMDIPSPRERTVARPSVRVDGRTRIGCLPSERQQACARGIRDMAHPHAPKPFGIEHLNCNQDNTLAGATSPLASMLHTSDQGFVHFDRPRKARPVRSHHGNPETLKHCPRHAVMDPEGSFQCLCGEPVLGRGYMPGGLEPCRQRGPRFIKDGPRGDGAMAATRITAQAASAQAPWITRIAAARADEARRPAKAFNVGEAGFRVWKHLHELPVGAGVVVPSHQRGGNLQFLSRIAHHNILGQVAITDYPPT